jgi:predicted carbohydrate-binding protein with CBM5 and CBM33 domain
MDFTFNDFKAEDERRQGAQGSPGAQKQGNKLLLPYWDTKKAGKGYVNPPVVTFKNQTIQDVPMGASESMQVPPIERTLANPKRPNEDTRYSNDRSSFAQGIRATEGTAYPDAPRMPAGGVEKAANLARLGLTHLPGLTKEAIYGIGN